MNELEETLREHGVDTSSLKVLFGEGRETIYALSTHGSAAIALWQVLRGLVDRTGYWPVVIGADDSIENHLVSLQDEDSQSVEQIIEASREIDGRTWLKEEYDTVIIAHEVGARFDRDDVRAKFKEMGIEIPEEFYSGLAEPKDFEDASLHGEWPDDVKPDTEFSTPRKGTWNRNEQRMEYSWQPLIHVALVPTTISWEAPAYLKAGSWNDCPDPEEHCAVFRYWQDLYGAEIVCMAFDTFEFRVAHPPQTREDAIALAEEQYGYCPDIVDQGVETIEALAATLLNGHIWYFWWD